MTPTKQMQDRGNTAAAAFVERIGMQVLDLNYKTAHGNIAIVATENGELVHVSVFVNSDTDLPAATTMKKYRQRMRDYMAEHHMVREVRYDCINIKVIAEDKALLRHYRDVTKSGVFYEAE